MTHELFAPSCVYIQKDIFALKTNGSHDSEIWSKVNSSENFTWFIASPRIQSLINRFYNHEMQSSEDPRLVKLALIMMLSKQNNLALLTDSKSEEDFYRTIKKELQKEFSVLQDQMELLQHN